MDNLLCDDNKDLISITYAINMLCDELMKHGDLYNGFLASIKSSVKEDSRINRYITINDVEDISNHILKRLIGEE